MVITFTPNPYIVRIPLVQKIALFEDPVYSNTFIYNMRWLTRLRGCTVLHNGTIQYLQCKFYIHTIKVNRALSIGLQDLLNTRALVLRETILKPCTFFQFGKVPCNLFVTPSYVSTWTNFSSKKHTNLSTMSLRFFVLLFCTFKSIEALVKCNGIVKKLQICSLDDTYDHGRFMQGLLEFILTEGYSDRSSNPGLALDILVL